ncbi:MAG: LamG domain-containing protein [Caldilineaceae bacterium]
MSAPRWAISQWTPWIFAKDTSQIRMIVDKRQRQNNLVFGYSFFLRNGQLGMSLKADGTETVYNSGFTVTPNAWHLVAVTVDRDVSDGIRFYVDGVEVGTRGNPTLRPNTLNNSSPLRIGSSTLAVTNLFNGQIDEVEIFNRVVTPGEIAGIFQADYAGKCKDLVAVPWDTPICKNQTSATIAVSVCNNDVVAHTYAMPATGGIVGLPAGAHPSCSVNFPNAVTYSVLTPQPINVPAGQCVPISVKINKPATLTANGQSGLLHGECAEPANGECLQHR